MRSIVTNANGRYEIVDLALADVYRSQPNYRASVLP